MTKDVYNTTSLGAKNPLYNKIRVAKESCYPEGIEVSKDNAFVPLQSVLDRTLNRLYRLL